ncbi:MAG TPA: LuxR C-terminal-related transcriptional regulator [Streptosporangiaceae bacterium]|nr:LuxR C-terminal-related transcriptional regulator [Streptosporangiaceae bacterium]
MTSTISEPVVRYGTQPDRRRWLNDRRTGSRSAGPPGIPTPGVPLLPRHRVTELLKRAAEQRITLVCGPTGSGKTIACATWAARTSTESIAWVSADPGDARPDRFWARVRAALAGTPALARDLAGELPDGRDEAFPLRLAELAESFTAPVTLLIDDVQLLAGSQTAGGIDLLLRHGPQTLRLLLSGRHPAGIGVARLRVAGDLAEIGPSDLACTPQEAQEYFAMLGVDLPADRRDELLRRTQGWITGLRLAAMRTAAGKPGSPWRISGDEPVVADYLRDEVLRPLPADQHAFLLRTCLADPICGDLADKLTSGNGGTAILDQLSRENVMVRPVAHTSAPPAATGPQDTQYRYHPLLLDLLRAELRRELPGEIPLLSRRAARWQAAHGRHADAIRNAAQAGDWDFAARVLAEAGPALLLPGPAAALEPVLATFPASRYAADAPVAGALAASGLRTGDFCAATLHLDNAEQALHRCPPVQRRVVRTWLQALRLMNATSRAAADSELIGRSLDLASSEEAASAPADSLALGLLWYALGVAALGDLRVADARDALVRACRNLDGSRSCGQPGFLARARGWRTVAEALSGDLRTAGQLAGKLAGMDAGQDADGDGPAAGQADRTTGQADRTTDPLPAQLAHVAAACLHWAADDPVAASRLLDQCEPGLTGDHPGARVLRSLVTVTRMRLALGDGDHVTARNLLTRLRYRTLSLASGQSGSGSGGGISGSAVSPGLAALDAELALREGDLARARLALARPANDRADDRSDLLLAQARLLLAEGDSDGALAAAERCLDDPAIRPTLADQVCALVTAAIAHRRLGHAEQATDKLSYALELAEPHRLYRPFLDGGTAARSALTAAIRPTSHGAALAARIQQRFDMRPARPADQQLPASVQLTSSELAVLRFLPSHLTNQEIAESLFLSVNTVKTHLRSIYRKLGVTTRRQAISRSGRLGLL